MSSDSHSHWCQAGVAQKAGKVRAGGTDIEVTFEAADADDEAVIVAAYEAMYPGSSAVPITQGAAPKSAPVRIWPR